jgi:outer membrane protein OmpA-like peptidoglycan-associated protein
MQKFFLVCTLLFSLLGFGQNKLEVFFDFNQNMPNTESQIKLNKWALDNKDAEITKVFGYCDSIDDSKYNKGLAMRRVNSMIAFFDKSNIAVAGNVELKSFGKDFKRSKNQSENRKVEVFYKSTPNKAPELNVKAKTPFSTNEAGQVNEAKVEKDFEFRPLKEMVEEERSKLTGKFEKAKVGDLIRINNISFYFNSEKVMDESLPILEELYQIMFLNPTLRIEIHGHICCNPNPNDTKLSYRRALVILKFLTKRGIQVNRLAYKGYGSNDPIYKVPEKNEQQRAANRRVEILIVAKPEL